MTRLLPVLFLFGVACSSDPAPAAGDGLVQGTWEGAKIRFSLEGGSLKDLTALDLFCGAAVPECATHYDVPMGDLAVDASRRFAKTGPGLSIEGSFSDATTAFGTFDFKPPDGCCHVVIPWAAEALAPEPVDCSAIEISAGPDDTAVLGVLKGADFTPLAAGDDVDIAFGLQGAYMLVLAAEASGFDPTRVSVVVEAVSDGAVLAAARVKRPTWVKQASGGYRVEKLYVASGLDVSALAGKAVTLRLQLTNPCGFALAREVSVTMRWFATPGR